MAFRLPMAQQGKAWVVECFSLPGCVEMRFPPSVILDWQGCLSGMAQALQWCDIQSGISPGILCGDV